MKTLMLLRHAKSPHPGEVSDHDRPVKLDAAKRVADMARDCREQGVLPQRVLSSDARRAADTARAFCSAAGCPEPILLARLYEASPGDVLEEVHRHSDGADVVMVVGHNPTMEACCEVLAPGSIPGYHMRTGACAIFSLAIDDWDAVAPGKAVLERLIESH